MTGWFSPFLRAEAWFDPVAVAEGWFDQEQIGAGGAAAAFIAGFVAVGSVTSPVGWGGQVS